MNAWLDGHRLTALLLVCGSSSALSIAIILCSAYGAALAARLRRNRRDAR